MFSFKITKPWSDILCSDFSIGFVIMIMCVASFSGCKKMVDAGDPVNTITTAETFSKDALANSAIAGIYSDMSKGNSTLRYGRGAITIYSGLSADEIVDFNGISPFQLNTLLQDNGLVSNNLWSPMYYHIYLANAAIEGLNASSTLSVNVKSQLLGEAMFIRAFCYFYLVNLFGDVPLVTSTDWASSATMARTSSQEVYKQIILDLVEAKNLLSEDYSVSQGERIRANKWVATALLARVYLYTGDYNNAEIQAGLIIKNPTYGLVNNLNNVFLKNSIETIWQIQPLLNQNPFTVYEGNQFLPTSRTAKPNYYLYNGLLSAFEKDDKRKAAWVDSTTFLTVKYYYPKKYKVRLGTTGAVPAESYTVFRLAEQYLIRAEARARLNSNLAGAVADLDTLRVRAGLGLLSSSLTQEEVISAIVKERRIEMFAEWGHRWFDLKRTRQADAVLGPIKGSNWQTADQLYPIPLSELQRSPMLEQNPGYN